MRVVSREGILALTLDAAAREAGVSKGGVLYHFATKDRLISGMIEICIERFEEEVQARYAQDPEPRGRWMRAFLGSCAASPEANPAGLNESEARRLHMAIVAAAALKPALLGPWRDHVRRMQDRFEQDGLDPNEQAVTWLAADGLWFMDVLGLLPSDGQWRSTIENTLHQRVPSTPDLESSAGHDEAALVKPAEDLAVN